MKAYVCDRCNKVINELNDDHPFDNTIWRYEILMDTHPYPDKIKVDLCWDCKKELVKWLREMK